MSSFLHTLRQDLRDQAILIIVWAVTLVTSVGGVSQSPDPRAMGGGSALLALAMVALWFILLSRLVYAHPPANHRAEWRTRPLDGKAVGAAKLVAAIVLLVLLPHLVGLWKHVYLGAPIGTMVGSTAQSVFAFLLLTLPILLLASFCPTSGRFLLALGGALAALLIATNAINPRSLARGLSEWDPSAVEARFLSGFAFVGMATVFVAQYHRARTLRNLLVLAGVGGLMLVTALLFHLAPAGASLPSGVNLRVEEIEVASAPPASLVLKGRVDAAGWPAGTLWEVYLDHLSLEEETFSKPLFPKTINLAEIHPLDTFAKQVGVSQIRSEQRLREQWTFTTSSRQMTTAERAAIPDDVTIRGRVGWIELRAERLASLPFEAGAKHRGNGVSLEVEEFPGPEGDRFTLLSTIPAAENRLVLLVVGADGTAQAPAPLNRSSSTLAFEGLTRTRAEYLLDRPAEQRNGSRLELYRLVPVRRGSEPFRLEGISTGH